jgi:ATP/maltotriose-dependent transcriptional regulator MalT
MSTEAPALEASVTDATRGRMLREMSRTVEILAAERPLVMVLEDLHWADTPAVQTAWDSYLRARSTTPAPVGPLLLADACRMAGRADEGLAMADQVWRDTRHTGLRWYDAELQRLRGELLLLRGTNRARTEAMAAFRRALAIAREQGARFYELRAATSLVHLCRGGGNGHAAHARLACVYAEFTEGLGTPHLRAAAECLHDQRRAHVQPQPARRASCNNVINYLDI